MQYSHIVYQKNEMTNGKINTTWMIQRYIYSLKKWFPPIIEKLMPCLFFEKNFNPNAECLLLVFMCRDVLSACICVYHGFALCQQRTKEGNQVPWNCTCRWSEATFGSSARAACAFNLWAIFPFFPILNF